jgi:hypothetical protein
MVYNYRGFSQIQGESNIVGAAQSAGQGLGGIKMAQTHIFTKDYDAQYRGGVKSFKIGDIIRSNPKYDSESLVTTTSGGKAPTDQDYQKSTYDAAILLDIPRDVIKKYTFEAPKPKGEGVQKIFAKAGKTFENPFAQGFKKYVVTQDFTSTRRIDGQEKKFKKGMNLFAKETQVGNKSSTDLSADIVPVFKLISYAGYEIPKDKVKLKNPNIYERIQSFFTVKKGFA